MDSKDVRWRQRFDNLSKAYSQLQEAMNRVNQLSTLEKEGLIQRFEYTFELAWKTLKDYLESQEVTVAFPREVIKSAFYYGMIEDGETWMDMLEKRNLLAHTYDEKRFNAAIENITQSYYKALTQAYHELSERY